MIPSLKLLRENPLLRQDTYLRHFRSVPIKYIYIWWCCRPVGREMVVRAQPLRRPRKMADSAMNT